MIFITPASWGMRPKDVKDGTDALRALYLALDENDPFCIIIVALAHKIDKVSTL
jgi:hypothetical protein